MFVDAARDEIDRAIAAVGLDAIQLHGDESPEDCAGFTVPVIKALRVSDALGPIDEAVARYDVAWVLLDSAAGGSGVAFDSAPCARRRTRPALPRRRPSPGQRRRDAVRLVRPYAVDTASGVEASPGRKDPRRVREFIENAKHA